MDIGLDELREILGTPYDREEKRYSKWPGLRGLLWIFDKFQNADEPPSPLPPARFLSQQNIAPAHIRVDLG